MKKTLFLLATVLHLFSANAQENEFAIYNNGLMYSPQTMGQLSNIVSDLNLQFQSCELHKTYRANYQALAHHIFMNKGRIKQAKADLEAGIDFEKFQQKYWRAKISKDRLAVRYISPPYKGESYIDFIGIHPTRYNSVVQVPDNEAHRELKLKGKYIINYIPKSDYSNECLYAFYFLEDLESPALPEKYARMVQYSNCMVDTSASFFTEKAGRTVGWTEEDPRGPALQAFSTYCEEYVRDLSPPDHEKYQDDDSYFKAYDKYTKDKLKLIEEIITADRKGKALFQSAVDEATEEGGHDYEFESYVELFGNKADLLSLKRNRIVIGSCSMDQSPRYHARDIAILSAETLNWEIFLRAHLNIMNDRFERSSDGSYAWARRKTYIRELEELQINVPELLLGISLRIDNPGPNHYYGNIRRLGRAMTESNSAPQLEQMMLDIVKDEELDDYNRVIGYYLFANYIFHLEQGRLSPEGQERLTAAANALPPYLARLASQD